MDAALRKEVAVLWDYMNLHMPLKKAQCIVGFGCYNEENAVRAAELYREGWAPLVLFTGALGRNTEDMWTGTEAERFAEVAVREGVPRDRILIENKATNTSENVIFTRRILEPMGITRILGVHKPFVQRRVMAIMGVSWPEAECTMTSPELGIEEYIARSSAQGLGEDRVIEILVGDVQRIRVYAERGYQLPQQFPEKVREAFYSLVRQGYTRDLVEPVPL